MSLAAAVALPITEPYYPSIYRMTVVPNAARKAYACIRYYIFRWGAKDGRITGLTNAMGAAWCTEMFGDDEFGKGEKKGIGYGSTRRRCFQYGLQWLRDMGIIRTEFHRGVRTIIFLARLPEPRIAGKTRAPRSRSAPAASNVAARPATPEQLAAAAKAKAEAEAEKPEDEAISAEAQAVLDAARARRAEAAAEKAREEARRNRPKPAAPSGAVPGVITAQEALIAKRRDFGIDPEGFHARE